MEYGGKRAFPVISLCLPYGIIDIEFFYSLALDMYAGEAEYIGIPIYAGKLLPSAGVVALMLEQPCKLQFSDFTFCPAVYWHCVTAFLCF